MTKEYNRSLRYKKDKTHLSRCGRKGQFLQQPSYGKFVVTQGVFEEGCRLMMILIAEWNKLPTVCKNAQAQYDQFCKDIAMCHNNVGAFKSQIVVQILV